MGNNTHWSADDLKKKGLVQNAAGDFVKVQSLTANGRKVDKIKVGDLLDQGRVIKVEPYSPLDAKIDFEPTDERAYTGDPKNRFLVDEAGQWEALSAKQTIDNTLSYAQRMVKAEQERAANPDKPHFHFESPRITLPNREREVIHPKFIFDMAPCPAPRMSIRDKYYLDPYHPDPKKRQRKCVTQYFKFQTDFRELCKEKGYELTERLQILCIIPMAESWSKKKKSNLNGQPHQKRGDWDNLGKAFCDTLVGEDNFVWDGRVVKIWGYTGKIIIF